MSIVITNFNYASYLRPAIDSALGQTHPRVEVVVVDDGSTDGSREIIVSYGRRVTGVFQDRAGQASAINRGVEHSSGDLFIFLDADDVLKPSIAARVGSAFQQNAHASKFQYRMEIIDERGEPTGRVLPSPHLSLPCGDLRPLILSSPDDLTWMSTSGNAYPAHVLRNILPIPEEEFRACPDWFLAFVPLLVGPVETVQGIGAQYRLHGKNSFTVSSLDLAQIRKTIDYSQRSHRAIEFWASRLELDGAPSLSRLESASFAYIGNRMISSKLDSARHPIEDDRPATLCLGGFGAAWRRSGVSLTMRIAFVAWLTAMLLTPRSLALRLATLFVFPDSRRWMNRVLARAQRREPEPLGAGGGAWA